MKPLSLNEALKYAGLPIKEEEEQDETKKAVRAVLAGPKEAWGYKSLDVDYDAKTVEWVFRGDPGQDLADSIAGRFKKAGLTGWTIKMMSRDERDSDNWLTAKS